MKNAFVSSTIVREIIRFNGKFEHLVPKSSRMYVVIEGIDTAGKSTQLEFIKKKYPNAIFTKEPGGTELGTKTKSYGFKWRSKIKNCRNVFVLWQIELNILKK